MNKFQGFEDELAILGIIGITLLSIHVFGVEGKEIVAALGGGLVGYIAKKPKVTP